MKVLLLSPPIMDVRNGRLVPIGMDEIRECPPCGIYMLASPLKALGHEARILDLVALGRYRIAPFEAQVRWAELVGIGATSLSWPTAIRVIEQIRRLRDDVPIVLGGIHPTMFPRYVFRRFPMDYVIQGEGEHAIGELCRVLEEDGDLSVVPNLWWITPDGEIVGNEIGRKRSASELASLPLPDYDQLPQGAYRGLSLESSRGCSFDCLFCSL